MILIFSVYSCTINDYFNSIYTHEVDILNNFTKQFNSYMYIYIYSIMINIKYITIHAISHFSKYSGLSILAFNICHTRGT